MRRFFDKYLDGMDEQDMYEFVKKSFRDNDDYYARGGSTSNSNRGSSTYHSDPDSKLKELASAYEKIQDFFQALGLDYKAYLEPIAPRRR